MTAALAAASGLLRRRSWSLVVMASASPAMADPAGPTDYRTEIIGIEPDVDGISLDVIGGDSFVELTVDPGVEVMVLGYNGEDYLRFDADGSVHQNERSPSRWLNDDRFGDGDIPTEATPDAEPAWVQVADDGQYAWHDHRSHWMNEAQPPAAEPGDVILEAVIPMRGVGDAGRGRGPLDVGRGPGHRRAARRGCSGRAAARRGLAIASRAAATSAPTAVADGRADVRRTTAVAVMAIGGTGWRCSASWPTPRCRPRPVRVRCCGRCRSSQWWPPASARSSAEARRSPRLRRRRWPRWRWPSGDGCAERRSCGRSSRPMRRGGSIASGIAAAIAVGAVAVVAAVWAAATPPASYSGAFSLTVTGTTISVSSSRVRVTSNSSPVSSGSGSSSNITW